jgi:hypothetical protein
VSERRVLRGQGPVLVGLDVPVVELRGAADGPRLCLLAGIHGCEYSSIDAVRRFARECDESKLAGSVTAVPFASPTSFAARSPFVVPEDGKNLNRCFPGDRYGSFGEALAELLFRELIAPSDVLLDLHGGDMVEALEPFALYDESPVEERARSVALAFGLPYVVRSSRADAPVAGSTCGAAAEAGIPAVIAEVGGRGLLEQDAVDLHLRGIRNVLRELDMLPGDPEPPPWPQRQVGRFVWLRCKRAGWWAAAVDAGAEVKAGDLLGRVEDAYGDEIEPVEAPEDGVVLFITSSPAVSDDGLLLGLGADVAAS